MSHPVGKYPNTFYRVTIKAIIRNAAGEILVVRENDSKWNLPGGGIDHGESVHDALKRELYEEALITADFSETYVGAESYFLDSKDAWLFWIVYELNIDPDFTYGVGPDADAVTFMSPEVFKNGTRPYEQLIYKLCYLNRL